MLEPMGDEQLERMADRRRHVGGFVAEAAVKATSKALSSRVGDSCTALADNTRRAGSDNTSTE